MKRCPLCDFIYEDEQNVCDMDGIELVHDPAVEPAPAEATATKPEAVVSNVKQPDVEERKESRLTSILNRTGRRLKKPFGL